MIVADTLPGAIVEDLLAVPDEASITIARLREAAWASSPRASAAWQLAPFGTRVLVRPDQIALQQLAC